MLATRHLSIALVVIVLVGQRPPAAFGVGAVLNKSGPIQITADGQFVWAVNPDHESVSRLRTADGVVTQFALPATVGRHNPKGLAILPNGGEVWVAAHDSDRVFVLNAASGAIVTSLALDHGTGPISVAISPDGTTALVALHRSAEVAVFDTATHTLVTVIQGLFRRPFGLSFTSAANQAWVTHTLSDGEDSHLTKLDTLLNNVAAQVVLKSVNPKEPGQIPNDPVPIPEGGYLLLRGHLAQPPSLNQVWVPVQYQNFHNTAFTPDSTIQAAIHKLDLATQIQATGANPRVVLTAVYAHQHTTLLGPGWNAGISGPVDLAFNATGTTAYLVGAQSNDVLVFPTTITMSKPVATPPLTEINVGDNPIGIVASPTSNKLYVLNYLSRDVSVIDTVALVEEIRIPITAGTPEPLAPDFLLGAKLFNSTTDPRMSGNGKVTCASCHPNGETDALIWEFSQFGAGHRRTLPLRGLYLAFGPQAGGLGQLHRSGDRDEVQDFEFTTESPLMGGTGFLTNANPPLGAPNAGLNSDLDALAAYVLGLSATARSPNRNANGSLSEAAVRGATIYANGSGEAYDVGCGGCHPAPTFTDLGFHNVGGLAPSPEFEGPNFNTPSLVGSWEFGPHVQATGNYDAATLGGVLRNAQYGVHGDTNQMNRTHLRDLEAFLNSIDGDLAQTGISGLADVDPPRVVAVAPVSLSAVEVIFSETVHAPTAGDPANYSFTNGLQSFPATAATVDAVNGNRVRVSVALAYHGCPVTYMLLPSPIQDVAGAISGGANNVLNTSDPANQQSFLLDSTITVTFGETGSETFGNVAKDASFIPGLTSWSHARVFAYPYTSPEMKGFASFDFVPTLANECGVTSPTDIVDARFSLLPSEGHRTTLELRRCLMPWGEPPHDWCQSCTGTVTASHSTYNTIPWHQSGAQATGGSGTTISEYYPTGAFDVTATVDDSTLVSGINERVEFSGPLVTDAFRFWFNNPTKNFGYSIEVVGNNGVGTQFWGADQEDGENGLVLSITFSVPTTPGFADCNANGTADDCDISGGASVDVNANGIPDECEPALVSIVAANPPTTNPYGPAGPFRDVLQNTTTDLTPRGIGAAGTQPQGPYTYDPASVTFSSAPSPAPSVGNIAVACTDLAGNGPSDCPVVTTIAGSGAGPYLISLSKVVPPRECTTFTFAGTVTGTKLQYQSLPGDVTLSGVTSAQDVLSLVFAINNGTAGLPGNLARYNINREGTVTAADALRLVQLLNGVSATQSFVGASVATCP